MKTAKAIKSLQSQLDYQTNLAGKAIAQGGTPTQWMLANIAALKYALEVLGHEHEYLHRKLAEGQFRRRDASYWAGCMQERHGAIDADQGHRGIVEMMGA